MDLLNEDEIKSIAKQNGFENILNFNIEEFPDKVVGYLGDHLKLIVEVEREGVIKKLKFFVKCMPRFDQWKAQYLRELNFFTKEYVMLSSLFEKFKGNEGKQNWRPRLLFIKEEIFVFEDVTEIGYRMPNHRETMSFEELKATTKSLAKFHAQSYIYEEKRSRELGRPYRIWEDYSKYLEEPDKSQNWRDTGRNAVIDYLKIFSKYKSKANFSKSLETIIPMLFNGAITLMKPSNEYRNAVVHRDLWTNNIFIKKQNNSYHALFVDFQTVLYCSPMLDLSSLIFFNTTKKFRDKHTQEIVELYYDSLSKELNIEDIDASEFFDKKTLIKAYEDSVMFALTQAALIVPIVSMSSKKREQIFCDPDKAKKADEESRSEEFIEMAKEDSAYQIRVTELLDEIVERYIPEICDTVKKSTDLL